MKLECLEDFDVPWCRDLLSSNEYAQRDTRERRPPPPWDEVMPNTLICETFKTEDTIRAWLVLNSRNKKPGKVSQEVIVLLSLGPGLQGHKGIAHGGVSALVMDQVIGMCATMAYGPSCFTAESWQRYKQSIKLPGVVMCRAVCTQDNGKHISLECTIEDGSGKTYCEGGAVCVVRDKAARSTPKGNL